MSDTPLADQVSRDHLAPTLDLAVARDLFRRHIRMVEIEVFSYCNRKCWYCPNATIDRISSNILMRDTLYSAVIDQLGSIDYAGMISYSRYNEPFADRVILDRIREARAALPLASLHTNTNGDYLDFDYLEEIYDAGMRSLNIQFYLRNEERYNHEGILQRADQVTRRLRLPFDVVIDDPGRWLEYRYHYKDMKIRAYGRNFELNGTSRGDQVDIKRDYVRTSPCLMPFWSVYIDHDGHMMPCCNLRSDIPDHEDLIVGDLARNPDLFLQYANLQASRFRRTLLGVGPKEGLCGNCHFALETPSEADVVAMEQLVAEPFWG